MERLDNELEQLVEVLNKTEPSSEEYTTIVRNFETLHKCKIEIDRLALDRDRLNVDYNIEDKKIEYEHLVNMTKIADLKKDRTLQYVKVGTFVVGTLVITVFTIVGESGWVVRSKLGQFVSGLFNLVKG